MKLRGCEPLPSARAAHGPPRGRPAGSASPGCCASLFGAKPSVAHGLEPC